MDNIQHYTSKQVITASCLLFLFVFTLVTHIMNDGQFCVIHAGHNCFLSTTHDNHHVCSLAFNHSNAVTQWQQYNAFLSTRTHQPVACVESRKMEYKIMLLSIKGTTKLLGFDPLDHLKDYKYEIHHLQTGSFILVTITEFHEKKLSAGGSSFRGLVYAENKLALCTYTDHFNGTYTVQCPMSSHCVHVNLTLLHTGFSQYQGITKRLDHVLMDAQICATSTQNCVTLPQREYWCHDEHHSWKWHSDIDFPVTDEEMCKMLDALGRLFMVGSSHMFYQYQYLLERCANSVPDLKHRLFHVNVPHTNEIAQIIRGFANSETYAWCHSNHTAKYTKDKLMFDRLFDIRGSKEMRSVCNRDILVNTTVLLQTGSWDLAYNRFQFTLKMLYATLEPAIRTISSYERRSKFLKVLMMGPPPFYSLDQYATCRNDDIIQIFSHTLGQICGKHKLRFLSVFDIVYPRFNESLENSHYLSCYNSCVGDVGKVVMQVALHTLRKDYK